QTIFFYRGEFQNDYTLPYSVYFLAVNIKMNINRLYGITRVWFATPFAASLIEAFEQYPYMEHC
ncbi:MAG: hypothetical protein LBK94_09815, partial [Prevotellaceae bacterium]|nr:hypothetical protein [Prevotellaceae bacterium]